MHLKAVGHERSWSTSLPHFTHLQSTLTDILQFTRKVWLEKALRQMQGQVLPDICILSLTCCRALVHRLADNQPPGHSVVWLPKGFRS